MNVEEREQLKYVDRDHKHKVDLLNRLRLLNYELNNVQDLSHVEEEN